MVELKLILFAAVRTLWSLVTLLLKLFRILLKWKYKHNKYWNPKTMTQLVTLGCVVYIDQVCLVKVAGYWPGNSIRFWKSYEVSYPTATPEWNNC